MNIWEIIGNHNYTHGGGLQKSLEELEIMMRFAMGNQEKAAPYLQRYESLIRQHGACTPQSITVLKAIASEENRAIIEDGNLLHLGNCKSQSPSMPHSEGVTDDMASKHRELYTYTDAQGNDCTVRLNGQSKQDTDRKFQELLQDISPVAAVPSKTLRESVMDDYRPTFLIQCKPTTQTNYKIYEDNYILPCIGDKPLATINNKDVQNMMDWMAKGKENGLRQNIVHGTIDRVKGHLSTLFDIAKDLQLIKENPIKNKLLHNNGSPSVHHKALPPDLYAEAQRQALIIPNREQRLYACLLVYTGMRPEEIRGLQWDQVHLDKGYCCVQEVVTYAEGKKTFVNDTPKTESSIRTVLLPPPVVNVLRKEIRPCGYVIGAGRDPLKPIPNSTFRSLYTKAFKSMGIYGKCVNYDFRSSFATWLKENGLSADHIADLMGHSDTRMVNTVYAPTRHESIIMHQDRINALVESQFVAPS